MDDFSAARMRSANRQINADTRPRRDEPTVMAMIAMVRRSGADDGMNTSDGDGDG